MDCGPRQNASNFALVAQNPVATIPRSAFFAMHMPHPRLKSASSQGEVTNWVGSYVALDICQRVCRHHAFCRCGDFLRERDGVAFHSPVGLGVSGFSGSCASDHAVERKAKCCIGAGQTRTSCARRHETRHRIDGKDKARRRYGKRHVGA